MTKDSWVKELHTILEMHFVGRTADYRKAEAMIDSLILKQISLAEKRVERKWRERAEKLKNKPFKLWLKYEVELQNQLRAKGSPEIKEEDIRWIQVDADRDKRNNGYNQALSDLIKGE